MVLQIDGVALGRWSDRDLAARLAWARGQAHSYDHRRSTLAPGRPPGVPEQALAVDVDGDLSERAGAD
jgi:hypothetical protein